MRLIDYNERSQSVDEFRRATSPVTGGDIPLIMNSSAKVKVQTKDDTTQCISVSKNNGNMLTGRGTGTTAAGTPSAVVSRDGSGRRTRRRFKRRQPFCLKATLANFSTFCRQTSLHGWQYIAQKNSSSAKHMFWAVVVSLSMATAALFLYNNTMDYLNATVSDLSFTQFYYTFTFVGLRIVYRTAICRMGRKLSFSIY